MKKILIMFVGLLFLIPHSQAQIEPTAGTWKTWFITSGKAYRLLPPASYKAEIEQVLSPQQKLDSVGMQQIQYWNAGAPGYHWQDMMNKLWMYDTSYNGALANMLLGTAIYDATVAAWDTKYVYNRPRPFAADKRVKIHGLKPESPSYPCEHSVAAGVAVTIIAHFYPALADSVNRMAQQLMASRVAAGMAFPSDTRAGFELGKKIAAIEIEHTKDFVNKKAWDGKIPEGAQRWRGEDPMFPLAGLNKTVVLTNASQFRPGPPPDFTKEMEEIKNQKPTFRSMSNAFFWASQDFWGDQLTKKLFEYNLHLNPPKAAQLYAIAGVTAYDAFAACWDAKYAYWGIRPNQYDTTYQPVILVTPPFPGYPSGHAMMSGMFADIYSYFFPADSAYFQRKAKEAAESRFQAGIHFRTDNEVGLELGRKVAAAMIQKVKTDANDHALTVVKRKKIETKK